MKEQPRLIEQMKKKERKMKKKGKELVRRKNQSLTNPMKRMIDWAKMMEEESRE